MALHSLTIRGIPAPVLKALREEARLSRRSLNAEVLVRLEAGVGEAAPSQGAPPGAAPVREPEAPPYEVRKAFEEADLARLRSDLALTPEQRVLAADQMLDDVLSYRARPKVHTLRMFDTWEDYLVWKRTDRLP